ncbi:MAG TPA: hypothetical protein VM076_03300 [Gemmatimonadaceae bacterium]|nr:hypothetical protein [Gemmatimonadaceae bacterium]
MTIVLACAAPDARVSITTVTTGAEHAVNVSGVPGALRRSVAQLAPNDTIWPRVLGVYVDQPGATPIIGRYSVTRDGIRFTPRFPLTAGTSYRVDVDTSAIAGKSSAPIVERFSIPAVVRQRTTRVVAVHPSSPELPENTLRWYIEFSAPMETGTALSHVHLMDEAGREVTRAFLALDQELWDPERRRITLLFDPGRVKRGVRTNEESGAPLIAGRRYKLVIDGAWPDGDGAALVSGAELAFEAVRADRQAPNPGAWRLTLPAAGKRDELRVAFGESLDHALAQRMVSVYDMLGVRVRGTATTAGNDSVWVFAPERPWSEGDYSLHVDSALEDVAGNSVSRVFDADRRTDTTGARTVEGQATRVVKFRVPPVVR